MKLFTGSLAAGLVLLAAGAQAQVPYGNARSPYAAASDFDAPYAMAPPAIPGSRYRYGPSLLPSTEVYAVLRDNGFSPLGIPRLRGFVYTIAVLDRETPVAQIVTVRERVALRIRKPAAGTPAPRACGSCSVHSNC